MPFKDVRQNIISDAEKLSFDYVPDVLVHREKEMQHLFSIFRAIVDSNSGQRAFLTGNVGTGKSVLSKRFCLDFQDWAAEKGHPIEFAIVNCRARTTPAAVLLKILERFDPHFPDRGFSITEMLEILRKHVDKRKVHLIVVLDEVNVLVKKSGTDLLYALTRFDEERIAGEHRLSLILISQKTIYDFLDAATLSTFKRTNTIKFNNYDSQQLYGILEARVELALFPGVIEPETIGLIAEIASEYGDARFAIELLENAGRIASEEEADTVDADHVRSAKAMTHSVVTEDKLRELADNKLLALLGIAREIRGKVNITTGQAEKGYAVACEEYGETTRGHTQHWEYLKELEGHGFIGLKLSGRGQLGKTKLISLPDIPARVLEEKIGQLLNERARGRK